MPQGVEPRTPVPGRRRPLLVVGVAAPLIVVAAVYLAGSREEPRELVRAVAVMVDAMVPLPVAEALPPAAADAAPPLAEIDLEIQVRPAGAEAFLDGLRLGEAPGVFRVAEASTRKRLELRKAGYQTWTTEITPSKSLLVPVVLQKKRAAPPRRNPEDLEKPEWGK